MNRRMIVALPLALALAACMQDKPAAAPAAAPTVAPAAAQAADASGADASALGGHRWVLASATDAAGARIDALFPEGSKGLALAFADGSAALSGGCNRMSGGFQVDAQGRLAIAPMRATMMACAQPLMQADEAAGRLLAQPQRWRIEPGEPPRLLLESDAGSSTWIGEATPGTRFGGPGETVLLEVAPQRVACHHPMIPEYRCLWVREVRFDADGVRQPPPGEWQLLYEDIEGFDFREGERKVLRLKKFQRTPTPADASSIAYVLDMVVESELVPGDAPAQ
jgi:heat shock protein HslJ